MNKNEKINSKSLPRFSEVHKELVKKKEFDREYKKLDEKYGLIEQIIDLRIKKNISQKQLAKKLGTGQSAISRLESGTYNPSYKFLQKLAKALGSELEVSFK